MMHDPYMAFSRFGLGTRPGDLARLGDPQDALVAELDAPNAAQLTRSGLPDSATIYADARAAVQQRRQQRKAGETQMDAVRDTDPALPQAVFLREIRQRMTAVSAADIGFGERLVAFWTNHFAIAAGANQQVRAMAGAFEREAIRPHVLGRFSDMVTAATQHPAMLVYLNNAVSIGPDSPLGRKREKGLNENHGRELMELHTLGVDGGYTQADVTSLAKILTGWSIGNNPNQPRYGQFQFRRPAHEPGAQTVLSKVYAEDGERQGMAVLADLSLNPATASHVVGKFVCYFVSDTPPPDLVERLTQRFVATKGDLKDLATALVRDDAAWTAPAQKLRTPQEFIWAAIRALSAPVMPRQVVKIATDLGQTFWNPPSPAGFKDDLATWLAPDGMTNRLDAAELLASRAPGIDDPRALATDLLGQALSAETATAISRAESPTQGLALLLMSPEFQRR